tara:strand:- start:807 stop:1379 length:573 start_codon:yes stop_codon:yes gene_type:complete
MVSFIIILIIIYILYEIQNPVVRNLRTRLYCKKGKQLSIHKNKKLLIIGDPCRGNVNMKLQQLFPNCGHGDITVDLFGCDKCDKMDINNLNEWKKYKTNSCVIVETATLSFGKDIKKILKEIKRISGGDFYSAGGTTTLGWKYYGHKQYSKKYPNSLHNMIYPFTNKDKFYFYYNFHSKKPEKILWDSLY